MQSETYWFDLMGDDLHTLSCATEDCEQQPTTRFEAGEVGSNYCPACASKIKAQLVHDAFFEKHRGLWPHNQ